ncbi:FHA domain-containing protein [Nonomuraea maritima]|uniref:FHA domain-containing protein n=1 Tax=Nonomuraea maritima TaxID=683260 RepID=UPI00371F1DF0
MATCPQGHASGADDYCDVCGARMSAGTPGGGPASVPAPETPPAECPVCRAPRAGQFCEVCGHDYAGTGANTPSFPTQVRWEAVAAADHAYYQRVVGAGGPDAGAVSFPPYCPERSFALEGEQVRIGRRSRARNLTPEIDLTGPPEDTGISHLHAVLLAQPDGTWLLVDPGSANGTQVNGRPIGVNVPVPVGAGDRIHLGAWTVLTLREGAP